VQLLLAVRVPVGAKQRQDVVVVVLRVEIVVVPQEPLVLKAQSIEKPKRRRVLCVDERIDAV